MTRILREGYVHQLPLTNHAHICALDDNCKHCNYKEIANDNAKILKLCLKYLFLS